MHPKLKGFPNCYVVNLEESKERREYMSKELSNLGLNYKIISHKRLEDNNYLSVIGDTHLLKTLTIGCVSSHLNTIKWWYENTDEEMAAFFEDDVDFSTIDYWNFNFSDYIKKMGHIWDVLQLSVVHEGWPVMYPRHRNGWDHGLQCYIVKRHYAKKLIDFYFQSDNVIRFDKMPYIQKSNESVRYEATTENVIYGLGTVYVHPLFNHNVKFVFETTIHEGDSIQPYVAKKSYEYVKQWWETKGQHGTLDELFDYDWCCPPPQTFLNVLRIDN
jgi:GR25 family glycosyltransferase involved in LPS biosynthesis